jgi:hypothetical protein
LYFGILKNLEEETTQYGNFDPEGKLQGFGSMDNNFKGDSKDGWLDGYSHILTTNEKGKVDEIYCGNTKNGVLSGFGVLLKQNMRYFGNFKNENLAKK